MRVGSDDRSLVTHWQFADSRTAYDELNEQTKLDIEPWVMAHSQHHSRKIASPEAEILKDPKACLARPDRADFSDGSTSQRVIRSDITRWRKSTKRPGGWWDRPPEPLCSLTAELIHRKPWLQDRRSRSLNEPEGDPDATRPCVSAKVHMRSGVDQSGRLR